MNVKEKSGISGIVRWELRDEDGKVKQSGENHNLVTTEGDNYSASYIAGAVPLAMGFMVLGTGYTATTKTTTWLTTGYAGNGKALDSTAIKAGGGANSKIVVYTCTFAAGQATANGIDEVCLTNENSDASGADPNGAGSLTMAYAQITPEVNKGAADSLVISWSITFLGS